jgi:predicted porin
LENFEMKKTLVALAAFASVSSFAQQLPSGFNTNPAWGSGVLITGAYDVGYGGITYKGGNKYNGVINNGTTTSQIDFAGVQDLGGGTKADFFFESDINTFSNAGNSGSAAFNGYANSATAPTGLATANTATGVQAASAFGNGEVKAGLEGAYGYIAAGSPNNAGLDANQMTQPFGTAVGSGYAAGWGAAGGASSGNTARVRYDNSVRYLSPSFSGWNVSYTFRNKQAAPVNSMFSTSPGLTGQSGVNELAGIYRMGPINFIALVQKDDGSGVSNSVGTVQGQEKSYTQTALGGNYTVGDSVFFGGLNHLTTASGSLNRNTSRVGYQYTDGAVVYKFAYTKATDSAGATNGLQTSVFGAGADYNLSKTTALYFRTEKTNDGIGLLTSTESNGAAPGSTTATTATTAGFNSNGSPDTSRVRTLAGIRITF